MKKPAKIVVSLAVLVSLMVLVIHGVIFFNKDMEDCLRNRKKGDGIIVTLESGQRIFVSNEKYDGVPDMHLCSKR